MNKYTPGPWKLERTDAPRGWIVSAHGGSYDIAIVRDGCGLPENGYNARLIEAAPELLDALEYAIKQVPELATVPGIAAAIAKATGDTNE